MASSQFHLCIQQSFRTISVQVFVGLSLGLAPSTSHSIHFFTQSLSYFRSTRPYHRNPFCYSTHTYTTVLWLSGFCPGEPGWISTRRNIHLLTPIMVINHPLSVSSIYYNPWYPLCSVYMPDSFFPQSLFEFSLVYLLAWHPPLHTPYISSPTTFLVYPLLTTRTLYWIIRLSDVSRTRHFPDRRFPDKTFPGTTFPGRAFSRTRHFPDKTFPGQDVSRTMK